MLAGPVIVVGVLRALIEVAGCFFSDKAFFGSFGGSQPGSGMSSIVCFRSLPGPSSGW